MSSPVLAEFEHKLNYYLSKFSYKDKRLDYLTSNSQKYNGTELDDPFCASACQNLKSTSANQAVGKQV